jgi:hypothetical protein
MKFKVCATCDTEKPSDEFYKKRGKYRHGLNGSCKKCTSISQKESRERRKKHCKEVRKISRVKKREIIEKIKNNPCKDCGGVFPPYCMDFDHKDGQEKIASISTMRALAYSMENILSEIAKCDLVCSNCHRIRTFTRKRHDGKKIENGIRQRSMRDKNMGRESDKKRLRAKKLGLPIPKFR